jgi:hypothetical protein
MTGPIGEDLLEDRRELQFPLVPRHVADVRGADHVVHPQQRIVGVEERLALVDVDRGQPGPPGAERGDQRAGLDQPGPARVDEQRGRLHEGQVRRGHEAAGGVDEPEVQRQNVACLEQLFGRAHYLVAVGAGLVAGRRSRPDLHAHAERPAVAGDDGADAPVAVDAEALGPQAATHAVLPRPGLERRHLLRDSAHGVEDQRPRELGRRERRRAAVEVRRHEDPEAVAGLDVDVGVHAALADQAEVGEPFEQRAGDGRALADQDERLGVVQPRGEHVEVVGVVVPDRHVLPVEQREAVEGPERVLVVVEDADLHRRAPFW